jgi:hypothetical protein
MYRYLLLVRAVLGSALRPIAVLQGVADEGRSVVESVYPDPFDPAEEQPGRSQAPDASPPRGTRPPVPPPRIPRPFDDVIKLEV